MNKNLFKADGIIAFPSALYYTYTCIRRLSGIPISASANQAFGFR